MNQNIKDRFPEGKFRPLDPGREKDGCAGVGAGLLLVSCAIFLVLKNIAYALAAI